MYGYRPTLPQQQVIQVNGKASVDTIQLAPNSSILVMDTSAPIVWLCVSDGVGRVTATPYDITIHEEKNPETTNIEQRLTALEAAIAEIKEARHEKPDDGRTKPRTFISNDFTD